MNVEFFDANIDWKLKRAEFWTWKPFTMFCTYYLKNRDYEAYITDDEEVILLPIPSSDNLISFFIKLTPANRPSLDPRDFLRSLHKEDEPPVPVYSAASYAWSIDTAPAVVVK
jgi:hypothetical protein